MTILSGAKRLTEPAAVVENVATRGMAAGTSAVQAEAAAMRQQQRRVAIAVVVPSRSGSILIKSGVRQGQNVGRISSLTICTMIFINNQSQPSSAGDGDVQPGIYRKVPSSAHRLLLTA
eukprot:4263693-Pleurochrysis_carterae.AAC.8